MVKGDIGRNFFALAEGDQIIKFHAVVFTASKGFDGSLFKRKGGVWNDEIQVNINRSAKPATGFTGSHRAVKGKEVGHRGIVGDSTLGTLQPIAEGETVGRLNPQIQSSLAETKGLL